MVLPREEVKAHPQTGSYLPEMFRKQVALSFPVSLPRSQQSLQQLFLGKKGPLNWVWWHWELSPRIGSEKKNTLKAWWPESDFHGHHVKKAPCSECLWLQHWRAVASQSWELTGQPASPKIFGHGRFCLKADWTGDLFWLLHVYTGLHTLVHVTHRSTHGHTHTYTNKEQAKSHTGRRKGNLKHAHSECSTFLSFTQLSFQRLAVKQSRQKNATGHNWSKKKFWKSCFQKFNKRDFIHSTYSIDNLLTVTFPHPQW